MKSKDKLEKSEEKNEDKVFNEFHKEDYKKSRRLKILEEISFESEYHDIYNPSFSSSNQSLIGIIDDDEVEYIGGDEL
jgi:hypothetical protein